MVGCTCGRFANFGYPPESQMVTYLLPTNSILSIYVLLQLAEEFVGYKDIL